MPAKAGDCRPNGLYSFVPLSPSSPGDTRVSFTYVSCVRYTCFRNTSDAYVEARRRLRASGVVVCQMTAGRWARAPSAGRSAFVCSRAHDSRETGRPTVTGRKPLRIHNSCTWTPLSLFVCMTRTTMEPVPPPSSSQEAVSKEEDLAKLPKSRIPAQPRARLVIKEMILENFKSYAGAQRIGPFHKVRRRQRNRLVVGSLLQIGRDTRPTVRTAITRPAIRLPSRSRARAPCRAFRRWSGRTGRESRT